MQIFYVNCINVTLDNEDNSKYGEKPVGSALYLLSSMYNHSCAPNTESSFPNSAEWHVRARRNISAGQEIFVSYVAPMIGKRTVEERREHLYSHYVITYSFSLICANKGILAPNTGILVQLRAL